MDSGSSTKSNRHKARVAYIPFKIDHWHNESFDFEKFGVLLEKNIRN